MGGSGLRALIKALFRILVILANLDLGDIHFGPVCRAVSQGR